MKRRDFITLLGSAAAWPITARAQQAGKLLIAFLNGGSPESSAQAMTTIRETLSKNGYIAGQNITIEYRWAEGHFDRLSALAKELVELKPDVIISGNTAAALAARGATTTIPIVCVNCTDPVGMGLCC
jgi:putative tryptophan/tyrosine transport system substrate-binding protein